MAANDGVEVKESAMLHALLSLDEPLVEVKVLQCEQVCLVNTELPKTERFSDKPLQPE